MSHCQSIKASKKFQLSAGVDLLKKRRDNFVKKFNRPVYRSIDHALSHVKPKLVVIAVPTKKHFEVFNKVVKHKIVRFIICEKPMSYNLSTAKTMINQALKKRKIIMVNYFRNFEPGCIKMIRYISTANLGNLFKVKVYYFKGIFNNGSHFINLLSHFLGQLEKIEILNNKSFWKGWDPQPNFVAQYERGLVQFNLVSKKKFNSCKMIIEGKNGKICYLNNGNKIIIKKTNGKSITIPNEINFYQKFVLRNLENFISKKTKILCDANSALVTMKILNQINKGLK